MKTHTMFFYGIIAIMAMLYMLVGNMFHKTDINIFYYILTAVVVLGYGQYVRYNNAGENRKKKILLLVLAVISLVDMGICVSFLPKYTYDKGQTIIEERYEEAVNPVELDFPVFFLWGEHKFSKGCYEYFYDVDGDLNVYLFNQYTGESFLGRIVEDYDINTAIEKIIKEECIILEPEIIGGE